MESQRQSATLAFLLLLLFPAGSASRPTFYEPAPDGKIITVWKVGSPYENGVPDKTVSQNLKLSAEALGYQLRVEVFPAVSFADEFYSAFEKSQEPDILVAEIKGVIFGVTLRSGEYIDRYGGPVKRTPAIIAGIASSEKIRHALVSVTGSLADFEEARGGEYLLRTSRNYRAARSIALRSPRCGAGPGVQSTPQDIQNLIGPVIHSYLAGTAAIKTFEDTDRLQTLDADSLRAEVGDTRVCGYWGSDHLTFVQTTSTFDGGDSLGWITALLTFRKPESSWEFLAGSVDPVCNSEFVKEVPAIMSRIDKPWTPGIQPQPGELLAPEGGRNLLDGGKSEFRWQPSSSADVVAEVTEFARNNDVRLFVTFTSRKHTREIEAEKLPVVHGNWRWRVWSISDSGAIAFSAARSFSY